MKNLKIARRYAKALILIGKEDGRAEAYREELDGLARLLEEYKELEEAICNPLYESAARRRVLQGVIDKLGLSAVMVSFLLLLFDKGRMQFLSPINDMYHKMADELKGVARASLVTAADLSSETVEMIRTALSRLTNKEVVLEIETDPDLIGGVVTRIGDLVLDGSVRTQLRNMKEFLKGSEAV
ncbi:ATP synthase F1 subunit delta [Thermodesulfobacteriota bacterium]